MAMNQNSWFNFANHSAIASDTESQSDSESEPFRVCNVALRWYRVPYNIRVGFVK